MTPSQVEYSVSAPAISAARALSLHYHLIEKTGGEVPFSDHNVAVLIDVHTQSFRVKKRMRELFQQVYYPDVNELMSRMDAVRSCIEALDVQRQRMPSFDAEQGDRLHDRLGIEDKQHRGGVAAQASQYQVSAAALFACRMLQQHFDFVEKTTGRLKYTERNVAGIIDMCTEVWRLESAMNEICTRAPWQNAADYCRHIDVIQRAMQIVDLAQMRMPSYGREMGSPLWKTRHNEARIDEREHRRMMQIGHAMENAKTPEEQEQILFRTR